MAIDNRDNAAATRPILRAERLSRRADARQLIDDVSFTIESAEVVAVFGSSRSGKTSLLRLLNWLDEPTGGTVFLEGRDYGTIGAGGRHRCPHPGGRRPGTAARDPPGAGVGERFAARLLQIVVIGSLLVLIFRGPSWTSTVVLLLMMISASSIAAQRARGIPGAFAVSLYGIAGRSGLVNALMTWLGAIDSRLASLIPVGSMLIARA